MIKKILLTGATGFIGSHLLYELVGKKYEVIIIKRSTSDTWRINDLLDKVKVYNVNEINLEEIFIENSIDCAIHLATNYIKAHKNRVEVESMISDNIKFPTDLAELCVRYNVKNFINTGTFFEYKMKKKAIDENDPIEPYNFYAATKIAFGDILKYYSKQFCFRVIDLKLFAPFGEKDNEKLIIFLIKSMLQGKHVDFSGGEQSWNFTYVKDIVQAFIKGLKKIETIHKYESFNIGYEKSYSIKQLVKKLEAISGKKIDISWGSKPYAENEIFYVNCKNNKAKDILGWNSQFNLQTGLKETYNYYLNK